MEAEAGSMRLAASSLKLEHISHLTQKSVSNKNFEAFIQNFKINLFFITVRDPYQIDYERSNFLNYLLIRVSPSQTLHAWVSSLCFLSSLASFLYASTPV